MSRTYPRPSDLRTSREWLRYQFAIRGRYGLALRHANRCLDEIASYKHSFLLLKASVLACLERWRELASLLRDLMERYPGDPEVYYEVADFFAAHGDWKSCWALVRRAERSANILAERNILDGFYCTKLECLHALGKTRSAIQVARRLLRQRPRLPLVRIYLAHLENGTLRIEPWGPAGAPYLHKLRRLAT